MSESSGSGAAPATAGARDYRLLVPREWFRVDLMQDRWRRQLKTFVEKQADGRQVPAEMTRNVWATLRNTAEAGRARGAMEFYLLTLSRNGGLPASLLVSLMPPGGTPVDPDAFAAWIEAREGEDGGREEVGVVDLPAGRAVRVAGPTSLDLHVVLPDGTGYLTLSFSAPVVGMSGPMLRLCEAIAGSLRWVE
ncbi:hypothetical protein FB570_114104 [Streptomyces sp. T12]|uniref:hypothetical protein n=1 Tax=Streptomyces sp. T12 TaxID=477697 RepID=UPI0011A1408C|nr:hypothetical protein [Streptomyces sp. T12]TWD14915.1 hypothetical protein FB570_114104 [Streptomyces sp. T12]